MSHCRSPQTCSVCLGAPARRVELVDNEVRIDGSFVERAVIPDAMTPSTRASALRGVRRTGEKRRR